MEQEWKPGTTVYMYSDLERDTPGTIIAPPHPPDPEDEFSVYVRWSASYARWEYAADLQRK
jgi:hypothetical protein